MSINIEGEAADRGPQTFLRPGTKGIIAKPIDPIPLSDEVLAFLSQ